MHEQAHRDRLHPRRQQQPRPSRHYELLGTDGAIDATYAASAGGSGRLPDTVRVPPSTSGGTTLLALRPRR